MHTFLAAAGSGRLRAKSGRLGLNLDFIFVSFLFGMSIQIILLDDMKLMDFDQMS